MRVAVAAALAALLTAPAPAAAETVRMPGRHFEPALLTVAAGQTVVWRNDGVEQHTVVAAGGGFASPFIPPGAEFAHSFAAVGVQAYICTLHPFMRGSIVVTAGGPAPPPEAEPEAALALAGSRHGGRIELTARVTPPRPGALLALQLHFRERFAWRQVAHRRLGAGSAPRFVLRGDVRRRARLVLYDRAGAVVATSRPLRPWRLPRFRG
jgi:plastocyanin